MKKEINTHSAPKALGAYSQAIKLDNLLFVSGQIGINPATNELPKGVDAQAHQIFTNIKAICEEAKMDMQNTVKTTILLANINDYEKVNKIYEQYFTRPYPTRVVYEVCRLAKSAKLEVELIVSED